MEKKYSSHVCKILNKIYMPNAKNGIKKDSASFVND